MVVFSIVAVHWDFISYQKRTFERFMPAARELVIVNNGPNYDDIAAECDRLGLQCLTVPSAPALNPSQSHAHALNYVWHQHASHLNTNVALIDMDIFPTKPYDVSDVLRCSELYGIHQQRGDARYLWPGLLFLSGDLPDRDDLFFDVGVFDGWCCDTGGRIHNFLQSHPEVRVALMDERLVDVRDLPDSIGHHFSPEYLWEMKDDVFFHFRNSTNWMSNDIHAETRRADTARMWLDLLLDAESVPLT